MLSLQSGDASLVLAPELGGAIVGWTLGAIPLMRRALADAIVPGDVHGMACFPLVPYSNRIGLGKFRWDGHDHLLQRNFGDRPHTIHGIGWQTPWTVMAVSRNAATLAFTHGDSAAQRHRWPFAFDAEQRFTLLPDELRVSIAMTNRHTGTAPAGLGLHPYFPCAADTTLQFTAGEVWLNGEDMLPSRCIPVPPAWDHARGLNVGGATLDNCFANWDGTARISHASGGPGLTIGAGDLFRHLIVYTPPGSDFFCVEPVSHLTDAVNRMDRGAGHGLRSLAPGETLQGEVTFRVTTGG